MLFRLTCRYAARLSGALLFALLGAVATSPQPALSTVVAAGVQAEEVAIGEHEIREIAVDDDGRVIGARVRHHGADWVGTVRVRFDVSGGPRAEFHATIHRGGDRRDVFRHADGSRWRCAARVAGSEMTKRFTEVRAPRRCFGEPGRLAPRARVEVTEQVAAPADDPRPNIVLIMLDDMRDDDLQYMPLTQALLGEQGVRFVNSLAPYPLCCPARASVLTGQYAHNHRVFSHKPPWGFTSFDDRSTLATWLQDAGYHTTYLGKYLNGYGPMPAPGQTTGDSTLYVPPGWSDWRASIDGGLPPDHPQEGSSYRYLDTTLADNGLGFDAYAGRYQSRVYGQLSEEVVTERSAAGQPFFFYVNYVAPHHGRPFDPDDPAPVTNDAGHLEEFKTPMVPRDVRGTLDHLVTEAPGADWFDQAEAPFDRPEYLSHIVPMNEAEKAALLEVARQRAESLSVVDEEVAATIEALELAGELDETLVMLTSDNGYFLGEQGIRTGKTLPHEPSIHTPLLVRGPGIPAGEIRYDPFLSIDFAPTIAEFAGVAPAAPVDGMSMLPVARQGDQGWTRAVLTETGPRKTVRDTDESGEPLSAEDPGTADLRYAIGVRSDRYLYVHLANGDEELYDMAVDPSQHVNLVRAEDYSPVLALMRTQLKAIRSCDAAECVAQLPAELATAPSESILSSR